MDRSLGASSVKREPTTQWLRRSFDFACGFLLGIVCCIGSVATGNGQNSSVGEILAEMLLVGLILGAGAAVFGRRFWRYYGSTNRK